MRNHLINDQHHLLQVVRGLDRTRRDSAGSEGDRADGERSFEMQPVAVGGEGEAAGDTGDDELVVHREEEEEEGVDRTPKKLKTLFGLPPIVMMKLY